MDSGGAILAFIALEKKFLTFGQCPKEEPTLDLRPAGTSCFCLKFILFAKFEGFSNVAYIHVLT